MLVVDAHEDIAWNILTFGRDYLKAAAEIRVAEAGTPIPSYNGNALLGLADWQKGQVAVIFATLFASPARKRLGEWDTQCYQDAYGAYQRAKAQLDVYRRLAEDERAPFALIGGKDDLAAVLASWRNEEAKPGRVGLVPLMEGADPIREPQEVEEWFEGGVRIVGLAWEATSYAGGTHEPGPLTPAGVRLLEIMADFGMVLDLSHVAEEAYYQALERYEGAVIVSHANPRRFLPTSRGVSDDMIALLAQRGGVIGIVPYNAFLKPGWRKGDRREEVTLVQVADAIDHVCQVTGSAQHVGIGSDFDGGFGLEHVPVGIDSVADLSQIAVPLSERGFSHEEIAGILGGNWLRILQSSLPE